MCLKVQLFHYFCSSTISDRKGQTPSYKLDDCPGTTCRAHVSLTFDLGPTWTNVSNGTSTHDGEQLCKFILKSIQNYRSYGPGKNLTFKCDLDLGPTDTWMFQMAHLHLTENICVKLFWNPSTIVEVMVWTNSDRCTHERRQWTHIHKTVIVTTISRSPQVDFTKCLSFSLSTMWH